MVAIAMLGVLANLAITNFNSFNAKNELVNISSRIAGGFKQARTLAMVNKAPVQINVHTFVAAGEGVAEQVWLYIVPMRIDDNGGLATGQTRTIRAISSTANNTIPTINLEEEFRRVRVYFGDTDASDGIIGGNACSTPTTTTGAIPALCGMVRFNGRGESSESGPVRIYVCSDNLEGELREIKITHGVRLRQTRPP